MSDMLDYLDWFGDIPFDKVQFNEVDNAVLAQLAYVDFEGIIPTQEEGDSVTVEKAAEMYQRLHGKDKIYMSKGVISPYTVFLPQTMAKGQRYKNVELFGLSANLDHRTSEQFFAYSAKIPKCGTYVSFRGTDDTMVGWKENFHMTFEVVPSQANAAEYVQDIARRTFGPLLIGGHSKGANLAIYAGAMAPKQVQRRIAAIFNNDGPGFEESVLSHEKFDEIAHLVHTYIPTFDIVGKLIGGIPNAEVIESNETTVVQHSAMSWQVLGTHFVRNKTGEVDPVAGAINAAFDKWLAGVPITDRSHIFDELFDAIDRAGVKLLSDFKLTDIALLQKLSAEMSNASKDCQESLLGLVTDITTAALGAQKDSIISGVQGTISAIGQALTSKGPTLELDDKKPLSIEEMKEYRKAKAAEDLSKKFNFKKSGEEN